jgi:hypothetical protein
MEQTKSGVETATAFCCRGCFTEWYHERCLCCGARRSKDSEGPGTCGRPGCEAQHAYKLEWYSMQLAALPEKRAEQPVILLVAPTGSGKTTEALKFAVDYITAHPGETVVILTSRHKLSDEHIELLPAGKYAAAVRRGRHAPDPFNNEQTMCRREPTVTKVEGVYLDVDSSLCKYKRGKKEIKCPLYDPCAYQRQDQVEANIWFTAHENAVREMPEVFGKVGLVIIDESPLDAFIFGIDTDDWKTLALDKLGTPLPADERELAKRTKEARAQWGDDANENIVRQAAREAIFGRRYLQLEDARQTLYNTLGKVAGPVPQESLSPFVTTMSRRIPAFHDRKTGEGWWNTRTRSRNYYAGDQEGTLIELPAYPNDDGVTLDLPAAGAKDMRGPIIEVPDFRPMELWATTWRGKINPGIRPNMTEAEVKAKVLEAATNHQIKMETLLWELIAALEPVEARDLAVIHEHQRRYGPNPGNGFRRVADSAGMHARIAARCAAVRTRICGRITVEDRPEGRIVRMIGLNKLAKGWDAPTLILDATGDRELLKPVFPQLEEPDPRGWQQLARPANVRLFQCIDRTFAKEAIGVEGKDLERKAAAARRMYASVLVNSLEYGGADVGVIVYKSTEEWIQENCFVPDWLKLVHWGDVTGSNALRQVRALFVIGRPLPKDEAVTRQVEALFGEYIPERNYVEREHGGAIPIVPTPDGNTCAHVNVRVHPHPMAERLRRQITEGAIIHAVGRARAGSRKPDEPLDIHLWTNVPVPELGRVEPVFGDDIEVGFDALMLATAEVWLENTADAERAFPKLLTAKRLEDARRRKNTGVRTYDRNTLQALRKTVFIATYQRAAAGCKRTDALFMYRSPAGNSPREWLEAKLGPISRFEIIRGHP